MSQRGQALSRNPNMCASCSSLLDGMDDSSAGAAVSNAQIAAARTENGSASGENDPQAKQRRDPEATPPGVPRP